MSVAPKFTHARGNIQVITWFDVYIIATLKMKSFERASEFKTASCGKITELLFVTNIIVFVV